MGLIKFVRKNLIKQGRDSPSVMICAIIRNDFLKNS